MADTEKIEDAGKTADAEKTAAASEPPGAPPKPTAVPRPPVGPTESTQFHHATPAETGFGAVKALIIEEKLGFIMFTLRMQVLLASFAYLLPFVVTARSAYVTALVASLLTSFMRLCQRLPRFALSMAFLRQLMAEDSSHYILYSLMFMYPPPLTLVVVPIILFAVLHSASYMLRLLDAMGPRSAPPLRYLISLVEVQSVSMLRAVATAEILLLPYTIVALLLGQGHPLVPLVYLRFLMLRYASRRNPYSRAIFGELRYFIDKQAANPLVPAVLGNIVLKVTATIARLGAMLTPNSE